MSKYSYTNYDPLGRITQVGEKEVLQTNDIRAINTLDDAALQRWQNAYVTNKQVTETIYDTAVDDALQSMGNSRKRVVATIYKSSINSLNNDSTLFAYDVSGNVKTVVQHIHDLVSMDMDNGKKRIGYDYDLVSGKVNKVYYQPGKGDQFFYKYLYDADNRIIEAQSSRDNLIWNTDASYTYYLHGPLARTELGQYKVQ